MNTKFYIKKYIINPITFPYRFIKSSIICLRFPFLRPVIYYTNVPIQILPTWTLYTSIPYGWRKCFGIQMCKEIKKALLENGRKALRSYNIYDIGDYEGELRIRDSYFNEEVENIVHKYEEISYHTCIKCGRTAKYLNRYEPLCEKCITDKQKEKADKFYSDVPFYGWTNSEYYKNNKNTEIL